MNETGGVAAKDLVLGGYCCCAASGLGFEQGVECAVARTHSRVYGLGPLAADLVTAVLAIAAQLISGCISLLLALFTWPPARSPP